MRTHLRPRGMTLIEVMVALAVTLIVIAAAVVTIRSQQQAFADGQRLRGAQTAARRALLAVEQLLPGAGAGMDGALAFDLSGWTSGPCPAAMGTCARDSTAGPDELVFFSRDFNYWVPSNSAQDPVGNAWIVNGVSSSAVNVNAHPGDVFRKGQILLGVCPDTSTYAYFTVSATTPVPSTVTTPPYPMDVPLEPVVTANPFKRQDALTCASAAGSARLFLVNKYRFHVRPVVIAGNQYDPLLVLDRGLDLNGDGVVDENDEVLVSEGIESMQVGYVFANPAIPMAGATSGTAISFQPDYATSSVNITANRIGTTSFPSASGQTVQPGASPYLASSFYAYASGTPARMSNQQANISAVRVTLLARSIAPDPQEGERADAFLTLLLNQATLPSWTTAYANAFGGHDGYQRLVLDTTVGTPDTNGRSMTYF